MQFLNAGQILSHALSPIAVTSTTALLLFVLLLVNRYGAPFHQDQPYPAHPATHTNSVLFWVYKIDPLSRAKQRTRVEGATEVAAVIEVDVENPTAGRSTARGGRT